MFDSWIEDTRSDSAFHGTPYKMVSRIKLDNAGEWSRECAKWQAMVKEHGVDCVYSCPDRKESNAHVERSCGIVEVVINSLLYEANLPPLGGKEPQVWQNSFWTRKKCRSLWMVIEPDR